jgi:hypothetical protein
VRQTADDGRAIHHARHLREMLADADARSAGVDFAELAADAFGCVGTKIPHVDRRRTTGEPNHDDVVSAATAIADFRTTSLSLGLVFELQQLGQGQTEKTCRADLDEVAA